MICKLRSLIILLGLVSCWASPLETNQELKHGETDLIPSLKAGSSLLCDSSFLERMTLCACSLRIDDEEVGEDLRQLCAQQLKANNTDAESVCEPFRRGMEMVDEKLVTELICLAQRTCLDDGETMNVTVRQSCSPQEQFTFDAQDDPLLDPAHCIIFRYHC
ncbi:hypothetical protein FGB62_151g00 [Gracilaria domingensis]|nr:hypothetical protein FGB62_151g00 [Gracilaria domingensis]